MSGIVSDKVFGVIGELIYNLITGMFSFFLKNIPTLEGFIYGIYKKDKLVWSTFYGAELTTVLNPMLYVTSIIAGVIIVASVILNGMKSASVVQNPAQRIEVIDYFKHLAIVVLVLVNLPAVYDILFSLNSVLLDMFYTARKSFDESDEAIKMMGTFGSGNFDVFPQVGMLSQILVFLILAGLMIWAAVYYTMRRVTLIILMGLGPLMLAFWLIPKFRGITATWFKELIGSIFVQSIHGFVYWIIFALGQAINNTDKFGMHQLFVSVILWILFIPISESIRRLLLMGGDMQGRLTSMAGLMGVSALSGIYNSVKKAKTEGMSLQGKDGNPATNGDKEAVDSDEVKKANGALPGTDLGTTSAAEKMLKAGELASKGGRVIFGSMGAIMGAGMGPAGSMIGSAVLGGVGTKASGVGGRAVAGAGLKIGDRLKDAAGAWKEQGSKNGESDIDTMAAAKGELDTASWAKENKDTEMAKLREAYPDASQKDLEELYKEKENAKRGEFTAKARQDMQSGKFQKGFAKGKELAKGTTDKLTNAWAKDNEGSFNQEWEANNPQMEGESNEAYAQRRTEAFNEKVGALRNTFANASNSALQSAGMGRAGFVGRRAYQEAMQAKVAGLKANGTVSDVSSLNGAIAEASQSASSPEKAVFSSIGGQHAIAHQLAQNALQEQQTQGMSDEQKGEIYNGNYSNAMASIRKNVQPVGLMERGTALVHQAGAFTSTAVGGQFGKTAFSNFASQQQVLRDTGSAGFTKSIVQGADFGIKQATGEYLATPAVEQAAAVANGVSMVGGVVFGRKGYQASKKLASRYVNKMDSVQDSIASPTEVIQMAASYINEHGERHIEPGAIKEVTDGNGSYIQVKKQNGHVERVSRIGAGHSGLRNGDVIYRDLDVKNNMIVPAKTRGMDNPAYRLDSGGGKVASDIKINSNPNNLLGNPRISSTHQKGITRNIQAIDQSVDSHSFYAQDLVDKGINDVQLVIGKDRSYVQAMENGNPVRVSPYYAGDRRMSKDSKPKVIDALVGNAESGYGLHITNPEDRFFSSAVRNPSEWLPASLEYELAKQRLSKQELYETQRRKSGSLG